MAILNCCGWETGDSSEAFTTLGTFSVVTSPVRTGTYALRCNPAGNAAGNHRWGSYNASGVQVNMGRTAETFYAFYLRFATLPSGNTQIAGVADNGGTGSINIYCDASGNITLVGATTSATVATLTTGTWYRVSLRVTSNGTSGLKIDNGTEQTATCGNFTQDKFTTGRTIQVENFSFDAYYDDLVISDAALTGTTHSVLVAIPTGAGTYTGWASGTGTTFAEVDEAPHDSDTTYVKALATDDNTGETFAMQDASTIGVGTDTILAVKAVTVVRTESTSGTSTVGQRVRSSTTNSDSTGVEWTTSYVAYQRMFDTDPATSSAWTSGGFDGIEVGVYAGTIAQAQRCTAVRAMVVTQPTPASVAMNGPFDGGLLEGVAFGGRAFRC